MGGENDRWEYLVAGDAVCQLDDAVSSAAKGEVGIDGTAWTFVSDLFTGEPRENVVIVTDLLPHASQEVPIQALPPVAASPELAELVKGYVPAVVKESCLSGNGAGFLAEMRLVTVLFITVPSLRFVSEESLTSAQRALMLTLQVLSKFEGTLRQYLADDKGTVIIACFGLPPLAHENDSEFGIKAALELNTLLAEAGETFAIGVTTGDVFTGAVGR